MSKPDWKDAPEWAQYLAQDSNGDWYWFDSEPYWVEGAYRSRSRFLKVDTYSMPGFLEERPR